MGFLFRFACGLLQFEFVGGNAVSGILACQHLKGGVYAVRRVAAEDDARNVGKLLEDVGIPEMDQGGNSVSDLHGGNEVYHSVGEKFGTGAGDGLAEGHKDQLITADGVIQGFGYIILRGKFVDDMIIGVGEQLLDLFDDPLRLQPADAEGINVNPSCFDIFAKL